MKPSAIVYTSNTGYTAAYAKLLGEETGLPVCSLEEAPAKLASNSAVIYLGWLMAGKVQGYKAAAGKYGVCAVCGVGMGATGSQIQDVRRANHIPEEIPVFTLQGGFSMEKLTGLYKFMMRVMAKTVGKRVAAKPDPTPEERDMLELLEKGGSRVSRDHLCQVLAWYRGE